MEGGSVDELFGCVAWYVRETPGGPYLGRSIEVLAFDGERVSAIVAFVSERLFASFGLPPELD
jgi:hypothetical protein